MRIRETIRLALRGVGSNRLRSALTILGILIGVASVVTLVAVGNGSSAAVRKQFESLGTNAIQVVPGGFGRRGPGGPGGGGGGQQGVTITLNDIAALESKEWQDSIKAVVPQANAATVTAEFDGSSVSPGRVTGSTDGIWDVANWKIGSGRLFTVDDVDARTRLVVLGSTVATNLFGDPKQSGSIEPIGETIKLNGNAFQVIGVLNSKGTNGFQDQDDVAFVPLTTLRDTLAGGTSLSQITVQATSQKETTNTQDIVTNVLASRNGKSPTSADLGFRVLNASTLIQSSTETAKTLTVLLAAVAAISLLVGGIGIMNIMLVTVTERTREIGIRKAVGAQKKAILSQFLLEAVVLGSLGGLVGVGLGLFGSHFKIAGVQPVVSWPSVFLALGVAVTISIFFGFYPANRAASMRPIDALRHE
jgi:putative ABC transport system permease protein